ncbi:MAG: DUF4037 domain-containing protein [Dehalococcoidia bacterium]|nr:DUF4037 domain-containing protein [Dehalococcoidia bacterium]
MQGLQLGREYYGHLGAPMLRERFGELADRIAVGLVGPGSECFGFDDEISRDHDWGPAFCMWLTSDDYRKHGRDLQKAYKELPGVFEGFGPRQASPGEERRVGACSTVAFYASYTGLDHLPATLREWLSIPEASLATCTNGQVFADPLGEFTRWRDALLAFYPEDVRLKRIASRCFTIAQSGQYNLSRSLKRGETFAASWFITQFCADMMSLVFLLNRRYAPFHKWMHRAVKELPLLGQWAYATVTELVSPFGPEEKPSVIEGACAVIVRQLRSEGLTDSSSDFLVDHAHSVHSRIKDASLRQRFSVIS